MSCNSAAQHFSGVSIPSTVFHNIAETERLRGKLAHDGIRSLGTGLELPCNGGSSGGISLKRHSQLAHMRIRYHFMDSLHITEARSILFLTKCDKKNIIGSAKPHSKTGFLVKD